MKQQHTPKELLLYSGGAAYSVNYIYAALVSKDKYIDAQNMRLTAGDFNQYALKQIDGEELKYPATYNPCNSSYTPVGTIPTTYSCIYADSINNYLFEVWADSDGDLPTFFRVNGKIVAYSSDIPFLYDYPIRGHKNEGTNGGEIFLTDDHTSPHIYSLKDLCDHGGIDYATGETGGSCGVKYFTGYQDDLYSINQKMPADHPVFIDIQSSLPFGAIGIGSKGMKVGSVQYAIAYVDKTGNQTGWSEPTPLIPIPQALGRESRVYPFKNTYGAQAGTETVNGVWIKFRVTNLFDYSYIRLRRITFNTGSPLGSHGTDEVIYELAILPQQISIASIYDLGAEGLYPVDPLTTDNARAVINKCADVRYFEKQLYLFNVEYQSRSLDSVTMIEDESGDKLYPCMYFMGTAGHKDMWNQVYRRAYMHGERVGFGVRGKGGFGEDSFVLPLTGTSTQYPDNGTFDNFLMPERRDAATAYSALNTNGLVDAATNEVGFAHDNTFEVFDLTTATTKTDKSHYKNILGLSEDGLNYKATGAVNSFGYDIQIDDAHVNGFGRVSPGYRPFHSVQQNDLDVSGDNYQTIQEWNKGGGTIQMDDFTPTGFAPNYHSLGMKLGGLTGFPSWVQAFSIDRTPMAGRVFCQGLGMYSLNSGRDNDIIAWADRATKNKNEFWFYSPDVESGVVDLTDVINNPSNYAVQIQCGLGFFTELYNYKTKNLKTERNIDMISYARILYENDLMNYWDTFADIGANGNGYTDHSSWRNGTNTAAIWTGGGAMEFDITSVTAQRVDSQRQTYYKFELPDDIYLTGSTSGDVEFSDANMKKFHEPVHIINIVRKDAAIDVNANQQVYYPTGTFVKLQSIIGKSSGDIIQNFPLVDERWEDCVAQNSGTDRFIYVRALNTLTDRKWVDITHKSGGAITSILADISSHTGTYADCYGVYTTSTEHGLDGNDRFFQIIFDSTGTGGNAQYYKPALNSLIIVKYDSTAPIAVYGGDTLVGESTCAFADSQTWREEDADADSTENLGQLALGIGWPYYKQTINERFYIANRTYGSNKIQDTAQCLMGHVRQMIFMFTSESRINIPLAFNSGYPFRYFPLQEYVMRPNNWKTSETMTEGNMYPQYLTDYPEETSGNKPTEWSWGGFRYIQSIENNNIDYSHQPENFTHWSKPKVGYTEVLSFPTRIHWSAIRQIDEQNSPSLKTFPVLCYRDIDDTTGEINKAFSALTVSGNNLYAFTQSGTCLVLTGKFMATQINGEQLGVIKADGGQNNVQQEIWISKTQGIPDLCWKSFAEYNEICWFLNYNSVWRLQEGNLEDIGREYYQSRIYQDAIKQFEPALTKQTELKMCAGYDHFHQEYWVSYTRPHLVIDKGGFTTHIANMGIAEGEVIEITTAMSAIFLPNVGQTPNSFFIYNNKATTLTVKYASTTTFFTIPAYTYIFVQREAPYGVTDWSYFSSSDYPIKYMDQTTVFVYLEGSSDLKRKWLGYYTYVFDKYVCQQNKMYGMRNAKTFTLDSGNIISNDTIESFVTNYCAGGLDNQSDAKEFWYARFNANAKPTKIEYFDSLIDYRAETPSSTVDSTSGSDYLLDRLGGYEQYIPRKTEKNSNRQQGEALIFRITFSDDSRIGFCIVDTEVKFKILK